MSEQITALLDKLKEDADLREKLQGTEDLDVAEALVKEAGFDVSKADWLSYQEEQSLELSDEELVDVAGGKGPMSRSPKIVKAIIFVGGKLNLPT
jgi:predicted ribosomally synthesized peptide with nif11-like leader